MRNLLALVIGMGVLIVLGVAVLATTIVRRLAAADTPPSAASTVLDQPTGTQMVGVSGYGDRLAIILHGGGPDRVVVVDSTTGRTLSEVSLAPPRPGRLPPPPAP